MPNETVQALREQLREKFPAAHRERSAGLETGILSNRCEAPHSSTGPSSVALAKGDHWPLATDHFPQGAITEISPSHPACGLSLLLASLLAETPSHGSPETPASPLVLIDARDRFDPASFTPGECARLLWLRCRETHQALQSADLLLRDGNLPFVLLDLSALPARELRRIPTASWHRLRQLAESSNSTLLALTPTPLIPRAALRLTLTRDFTLHHLDQSRDELLQALDLQPTRNRHHRHHARTA